MTCWFCHRPITGKAERHHILPKRYFKRGQDHRVNNIVWVHRGCHHRWNREFDDPRLCKTHYLNLFESIKLGDGVFAD